MTISVPHSVLSDDPGTSQTSHAIQLNFAQTTGDALVLFVFLDNSTVSGNITDTSGNGVGGHYQLIKTETSSTPTLVAIYYALNVAAAATNANTITVNFSTTFHTALIACELHTTLGANALALATGLATGNGATGNSAAASTTLNVTDVVNCVLLGAFDAASGGETKGASFTLIQDASAYSALAEYELVTGANNYTVNGTLTSAIWTMAAAAFIEVSAQGFPVLMSASN